MITGKIIKTTISMRRDILEKLTNASIASGKSRTFLITVLLHRFAGTHHRMIAAWSQVRYQERGREVKWHRLHVSFKPDEYEYCIDLRKVCKLSVSRIVAYSVENLLDDLVCSLQKTGDNYRYSNYVFSFFQVEGVPCWLFCWGIPPESPLKTKYGWT